MRVAVIVLLLAPSALATPPQFVLERIGAYDVVGSPGQVLDVPARILNRGAASEVFGLAGRSSNTSGGWEVYHGGDRRVAPGDDEALDAVVTVPGTGGASIITLAACARSHPASCSEVSWRVTTPLMLTLDVESSYGALEAVAGSARLTWLNGAPVANAPVRITQQTDLMTVSTTETFVTDGDGVATFSLVHPASRAPGHHTLLAQASLPNVQRASAGAMYVVDVHGDVSVSS